MFFSTDTDDTSLLLCDTFCLELEEISSVFQVLRFGCSALVDVSCLIKLVHNYWLRKWLAVNKYLTWNTRWNDHVAQWPTLRIQQLCMLNLAPSLTCRGTFYKCLIPTMKVNIGTNA